MADTQITAYSDQYYFNRPKKKIILNNDSALFRCARYFSGIFTYLEY